MASETSSPAVSILALLLGQFQRSSYMLSPFTPSLHVPGACRKQNGRKTLRLYDTGRRPWIPRDTSSSSTVSSLNGHLSYAKSSCFRSR